MDGVLCSCVQVVWGFELLLVDCWRNVCIGDGDISGAWGFKQLLVIVVVRCEFISCEWVIYSCLWIVVG